MQIYGILAHPAGHSLSPIIHNAGFEALKLEAKYEVFDVSPLGLGAFMEEVRQRPISGLSVSLPHKTAVMPYLDFVSEEAKEIGAVNTIKNVSGRLEGYNFDWLGAVKALEEETSIEGKHCVVIGAGGAARAIVYGLKKRGGKVVILNRTALKARDLAEEFGCEHGGLNDIAQFEAEILVQTTSCWLQDLSTKLVPKGYLQSSMTVMDIVYKPLITPLLQEAKKAGAKIVTGEKMLLYQAYEQFELWTKQEAPQLAMAEALKQAMVKML